MSLSEGMLVLGKLEHAGKGSAERIGLQFVRGAAPAIPFDKTLIVSDGVRVPWDLVPAGMHFLERWDAAVPLWRYGVLAADVGTKDEQKRTAAVVRDLRVLLHSVELLFVRDSEGGRALIAAYVEELAADGAPPPQPSPDGGGSRRLAFLRAMYRTKPRVCVLPTSWMAEVQARAQTDATSRSRVMPPGGGRPLVTVEISPGRFVKCYAGDEAQVKERLAQRTATRGGRHG